MKYDVNDRYDLSASLSTAVRRIQGSDMHSVDFKMSALLKCDVLRRDLLTESVPATEFWRSYHDMLARDQFDVFSELIEEWLEELGVESIDQVTYSDLQVA